MGREGGRVGREEGRVGGREEGRVGGRERQKVYQLAIHFCNTEQK